jgi:DUF1016 N-terminal domain
MGKIKTNKEFEQVAILIEEARNRAFIKVNEELVLLYFKVGGIVSAKVAEGAWGDNTVEELASYIAVKYAGLKGFNRRGLYRMKQFFESYAVSSECYLLLLNLQNQKVSPVATQTNIIANSEEAIVSALPTQLQATDNQYYKFVSAGLTQIGWMNHLMILSKTKAIEEKLYYLLTSIKEKYSTRELESIKHCSI